jgi:hypothetical protein
MNDKTKQGADEEKPKDVKVHPASAADDLGRLNPSSPAETGTTPGSNDKRIDGAEPEAAK